MPVQLGDGGLGILLRGDAVHRRAVGQLAAEQHPHGLAGGLAQNVPAGGVERRLGIAVPLNHMVHELLNPAELARVLADQRRCQKTRDTFHTLGIRHHIVLAAGRELAAAADAGIGVDHHHRRLRHLDGVAGTPSIGTACIGKVGPVDGDAGDLHGQTTMFPVWVLAMKARCAS